MSGDQIIFKSSKLYKVLSLLLVVMLIYSYIYGFIHKWEDKSTFFIASLVTFFSIILLVYVYSYRIIIGNDFIIKKIFFINKKISLKDLKQVYKPRFPNRFIFSDGKKVIKISNNSIVGNISYLFMKLEEFINKYESLNSLLH